MGQAEIQEAARPSTQSDTLDRPDLSACASAIRLLADGRTAWLPDGSCMSRETHVQFCESLRVIPWGYSPQYLRAKRASRSTSDEEHHEIHHAEAQAQSERVKECGGETAAAEVPWIHLYRRTRGQASNRAKVLGPF